MSVLCVIIPLLLNDYLSCHGNNRVLVFLEWCSKNQGKHTPSCDANIRDVCKIQFKFINLRIYNTDDYVGYGNSFHAKGGRGSRKAQLKYCLRMLRSLVTTGNEIAIQDLTDQGALDSLTAILKSYSRPEAQIDHIDVEILGDVFYTIAVTCEKDTHRKVNLKMLLFCFLNLGTLIKFVFWILGAIRKWRSR